VSIIVTFGQDIQFLGFLAILEEQQIHAQHHLQVVHLISTHCNCGKQKGMSAPFSQGSPPACVYFPAWYRVIIDITTSPAFDELDFSLVMSGWE